MQLFVEVFAAVSYLYLEMMKLVSLLLFWVVGYQKKMSAFHMGPWKISVVEPECFLKIFQKYLKW